ncbi:MAG: MFS transporter, partial [Bryobacteraceae bacterium]
MTMMPARLNLILWLLVTAIAINYVDRGALSVSAPLLAQELALPPDRMGLLFSAFFWSYALFQLAAGWLVDRYDVKWVYAAGFALWSVATATTGAVSSFATLIVARLALGVGESVAYPACSRIIVRNFPEDRRGLV